MEDGVSKKTPWAVMNRSQTNTLTGKILKVLTGSTIMPATGYGNSPYNDDYNLISLGQPVQIVIPNWITWTNVSFEFRVPQIWTSSTGVSTPTGSWIILWTMWYTWASLYASGESNIFIADNINKYNTGYLSSRAWTTNSGSSLQFTDFYTDASFLGPTGSKCNNYACTLKLSMINSILTADNVTLPFLEYRINFWSVVVPSQYTILDATAYSYGFQRSRVIRIPQVTTNTALDFAVLQ